MSERVPHPISGWKREITGHFHIGFDGWACTLDGCRVTNLSGVVWTEHLKDVHGITVVLPEEK